MIEYKVSSGSDVYVTGGQNNIKKGESYFVNIKKVSDIQNNITVQINRISAGHRTVFNPGCEIQLNAQNTRAIFTVGFNGNANSNRGAFTCSAALNSDNQK